MTRVALFLLSLFTLGSGAFAASFYDERARGWHWYEVLSGHENKDIEEEAPVETQTTLDTSKSSESQKAKAYVEGVKKDLEEKKYIALYKPTRANVAAYMKAQQAMMDRSELFSKRWMEALYLNPDELDYTVKHPTMQAARHIAIDEQKRATESHIKALSQSYGLFFFFSSACPYCHGFAPIVKQFSEKYGWSVMAVSLDGGQVAEFPEAQPNNGIAQNLNVKSLPTLLIVHPDTGQVVPLSVGMSAIDQIEERVRTLIETGAIHV